MTYKPFAEARKFEVNRLHRAEKLFAHFCLHGQERIGTVLNQIRMRQLREEIKEAKTNLKKLGR